MPETAKKSPDIYKWQKEQVLDWLEKKWYNKENVNQILEQLQKKDKEKTSKEINNKLDSLSAGSEDHINYLDSLIKEEQSIIEQAKQKANSVKTDLENKADDVIEEAKNWLMAKFWLDKILDKLSWMFDKVGWVFDKIWGKITLLFAWTTLWGLLWIEATSDNAEEVEPEEVVDEEIVAEEDKPEVKPVNDSETLINPEIIEKKEAFYYRSWKWLVENLLNDQFVPKNDFWLISDKLRYNSYNELEDITYNEFKNSNPNLNSKITKEDFEKVQKNLLWEDMVVLFNAFFTKENINKLLANTKTKDLLFRLGINSYDEFNFKDIKIEALFSLFSITVSSLTLIWIWTLPWIGENLFNKILLIKSDIPLFNEIKEDIKESQIQFEKNIISKDTISEILNISNIWNSWSFNFEEDNFKTVQNKEKITEILKFRDYIRTNVVENYQYNLWEGPKLSDNISFKDVLSLFIMLKWDKIKSDLDSSLVYMYIIKILDKWNDSGIYIKNIVEETVKENSTIMNKKEQRLIKVLWKKIIDKTWLDNLLKNAWKVKDAASDKLSENPEYILYLAWVIAILKWTPIWRPFSVLYSLFGKKWLAILASTWVFVYFYNLLDENLQNEFLKYKNKFKIEGLDIENLLKS
jgi:hypothetical protein